jgi:hypothetical protein
VFAFEHPGSFWRINPIEKHPVERGSRSLRKDLPEPGLVETLITQKRAEGHPLLLMARKKASISPQPKKG